MGSSPTINKLISIFCHPRRISYPVPNVETTLPPMASNVPSTMSCAGEDPPPRHGGRSEATKGCASASSNRGTAVEFWGHEIRPLTTVSFEAVNGHVIHLSQAALGETNNESEDVIVFVKVGAEKLAIGTLSADKHPQIPCDLNFGETFELSHSSKTASVFSCGYKAKIIDMFKYPYDEKLETYEIPVKNNENEKSAAKIPAEDGKKDKQDDDNKGDSDTSSGTDESDDSETSSGTDESDDSETSSGTDDSDDSETSSGTDDSDDSETSSGSEDDSSDSSEDETLMKPEVSKKRPVETPLKTPTSDKKAKISTPKKETGDKKSVHVDTPHPAKNSSKLKEKSPKSGIDSTPKKEKSDKKIVHVDTPHPAKKASKSKEKSPKSGIYSCKSCC